MTESRKYLIEDLGSYATNLPWEEDFEESIFFIRTSKGDGLAYNVDSQAFSLNNLWNEITPETAHKLMDKELKNV